MTEQTRMSDSSDDSLTDQSEAKHINKTEQASNRASLIASKKAVLAKFNKSFFDPPVEELIGGTHNVSFDEEADKDLSVK